MHENRSEYYEKSKDFAKALLFLDIKKFQCINILGFNSPEWFVANNGSILGGCVPAGIYSTSSSGCPYDI